MPCRSYEDDYRTGSPTDSWQYKELKENNDKLARIACKALTVLEQDGHADLLLLQDDEVREWWGKHKEADRRAAAERAERERKAKIKQEALSKLTAEEQQVLGINTKRVKNAR